MADDFFSNLQEARESGQPFTVVSVVETQGSVPRHPGAKMIVFPDGSIRGTVGGGKFESLVIAEAKDGGTNALLLRPPTVLQFAFATSRPSAAFHADHARNVGIVPAIVRRPGLARDIDTPDDLLALVSDHPAYRVFRHVA